MYWERTWVTRPPKKKNAWRSFPPDRFFWQVLERARQLERNLVIPIVYEQNLSKKEKDDWIYPPVGVCFDMAPIFFEVIVLLYWTRNQLGKPILTWLHTKWLCFNIQTTTSKKEKKNHIIQANGFKRKLRIYFLFSASVLNVVPTCRPSEQQE